MLLAYYLPSTLRTATLPRLYTPLIFSRSLRLTYWCHWFLLDDIFHFAVRAWAIIGFHFLTHLSLPLIWRQIYSCSIDTRFFVIYFNMPRAFLFTHYILRHLVLSIIYARHCFFFTFITRQCIELRRGSLFHRFSLRASAHVTHDSLYTRAIAYTFRHLISCLEVLPAIEGFASPRNAPVV